ncbi:MAG: hypothetical protein GY906_09885 [bacterium]|nr:hypothetical protein [bacterium]
MKRALAMALVIVILIFIECVRRVKGTMTMAMTMRMEAPARFSCRWPRMRALEWAPAMAINFGIAIAIETLEPVKSMAIVMGMAMGR